MHSRPNQGCGFCRRNRESLQMTMSHRLRDDAGRVLCPQLRRYRCPGCGATGDDAHTRSYCPNMVNARRQYERRGSPNSASTVSTASPPSSSLFASSSSYLVDQPVVDNQEEDDDQELVLDLGANRAFHNMARVTNSRYNSAGKLRNKPKGGQQNNTGIGDYNANLFENRRRNSPDSRANNQTIGNYSNYAYSPFGPNINMNNNRR